MCWGLSWGKDTLTAEGFFLMLLRLLVQGSYSLEAIWTTESQHIVAVAKFIVIPGNEFDKVVTEGNASSTAEKKNKVTVKVTRKLVLRIAQDAL